MGVFSAANPVTIHRLVGVDVATLFGMLFLWPVVVDAFQVLANGARDDPNPAALATRGWQHARGPGPAVVDRTDWDYNIHVAIRGCCSKRGGGWGLKWVGI